MKTDVTKKGALLTKKKKRHLFSKPSFPQLVAAELHCPLPWQVHRLNLAAQPGNELLDKVRDEISRQLQPVLELAFVHAQHGLAIEASPVEDGHIDPELKKTREREMIEGDDGDKPRRR